MIERGEGKRGEKGDERDRLERERMGERGLEECGMVSPSLSLTVSVYRSRLTAAKASRSSGVKGRIFMTSKKEETPRVEARASGGLGGGRERRTRVCVCLSHQGPPTPGSQASRSRV